MSDQGIHFDPIIFDICAFDFQKTSRVDICEDAGVENVDIWKGDG